MGHMDRQKTRKLRFIPGISSLKIELATTRNTFSRKALYIGFCPYLIPRSISDTGWLNFSWVQLYNRASLEWDTRDLALVLLALPLKNSSPSDRFKYVKYELDYTISLLKALQGLLISLKEKYKSFQMPSRLYTFWSFHLQSHLLLPAPSPTCLKMNTHTDFRIFPQLAQAQSKPQSFCYN